MEFYCQISAEFGRPFIIELGTSFGISAMYLAAAIPDTTVYTMEGCPAVSEIAKRILRKQELII